MIPPVKRGPVQRKMNSISKPGKPLLDIQLTEQKMAIEGSQTGV